MDLTGFFEIIKALSVYKQYIGYAVLTLAVIIIMILIINAFKHLFQKLAEDKAATENTKDLKNIDYDTLSRKKKASTLRQIIAPDAVDAGPNGYMKISDGGRDVYVRSFTIVSMPKRTRFANTFSRLLDFPDCTSSVFVEPIPEGTMVHKMDRHITILSSEYGAASGDVNRMRKLRSQFEDTSAFAEQVENGENKFFNVGFLFTLYGDSIEELNKKTDKFHATAVAKNIEISSCYAVQAEAFLSNAPLNRKVNIESKFITSDSVKMFQMDKYSVSSIYNYTQSTYSHKDGVAIGRDMFTADPVIFDTYDPSHDGFTIIIAGKTNCGKSATIKILASRQLLQGYHFVAIDSQARKGMSEGEYAGIAELCNGVNFQISNTPNGEIMNIFEVSESTKTVKDSANTIHEVRSLDLADKVSMVTNVLLTMIKGNKTFDSLQMETYISRILVDNITQLYRSFGIVDGNADSLYTTDDTGKIPGVDAGRVQKILPTLTDFYKQLLISDRDNEDESLIPAYNIILMALADYVRELYYSKKTCFFFDSTTYHNLPYVEGQKGREWLNDRNEKEAVVEIHGIRAYYDGQSSVHISRDCPFTNIDISQLPDNEKVLARQVSMDFINENFIKKNSETIKASAKLVCIFDECHENFSNDYARKTLDGAARTARKRNVSLILSSQTLKEYDNYPETQAILKQAAVKFIFKQDYQDRDYLIKTLGLTEAQVDFILNDLGGNLADDVEKNKHRGEMCIVDNKQVCFCKVDYLKKTEALPVETDAAQIENLFKAAI